MMKQYFFMSLCLFSGIFINAMEQQEKPRQFFKGHVILLPCLTYFTEKINAPDLVDIDNEPIPGIKVIICPGGYNRRSIIGNGVFKDTLPYFLFKKNLEKLAKYYWDKEALENQNRWHEWWCPTFNYGAETIEFNISDKNNENLVQVRLTLAGDKANKISGLTQEQIAALLVYDYEQLQEDVKEEHILQKKKSIKGRSRCNAPPIPSREGRRDLQKDIQNDQVFAQQLQEEEWLKESDEELLTSLFSIEEPDAEDNQD